MEIPRITETQIVKKIGKQKVILLYGTRRTGKSTIVENIAAKDEKNSLLLRVRIWK